MTPTTRTGRFGTLLLMIALALGLAGFAPATAAQAAPAAAQAASAQASSVKIRDAIVWAAASQVGQRETGTNYYPVRYKISAQIQRPAAWCGVFTNWAWYAGHATKRPNMAGVGVNQGHFATYWQKWAKANKRWKPIGQRRVARGDVIVYGSFAQSGHVGVVIDVRINAKGRATAVRTVEGNVRDRVVDTGWRSINALTGRNLRASGFVSPV